MKNHIINSIQDLENSRWFQAARNTDITNKLIPAVTSWLNQPIRNTELVQRVKEAVSILSSERRGELLTPSNLLILTAGLLYVVSPLDPVPDFIPVAGLLDDLAVIGYVLKHIFSSASNQTISPAQTEN